MYWTTSFFSSYHSVPHTPPFPTLHIHRRGAVNTLVLICVFLRFQLQHLQYIIVFLSSPLRVVSSGCRRAKREQDESPCGDLASKTATLWRPPLEAPLWVSLDVCKCVSVCALECPLCQVLSSVWMLGDRKGTHFTTRDLKSIGFYFCDTLLDYCDPDPTKVSKNNSTSDYSLYTNVDFSLSPRRWKDDMPQNLFLFPQNVFPVISGHLLSDRAGSVVEQAGQREAGQRLGHWL